jgi:dTDP-4-amino-4,6-dideoxygalactose transaminase
LNPDVRIPVARPLLPRAESLLPYLQEIDERRIYGNFGPLNARFEARLADLYGLPPENVVTATNATIGLAAALIAVTNGGRGRCLLPSWTFCASAHAVRLAGQEPVFLDVDRETWQLTPSCAEAALQRGGPVAAVLVVAPFGRPVETSEWDGFTARTGVRVVIDAAAAFAAQRAGKAPFAVSLHATKVLGIGEGAFVASEDAELIARIRHTVNFGFVTARRAEIAGLNGKLSEVAAAVGLAALDTWPAQRERWRSALLLYRSRLRELEGRVRLPAPLDVVSSTLVPEFPVTVGPLMAALARRGIDTRRWWGRGCHHEPAFADCAREDLAVTEVLAERCLGLPLYVDISAEAVDMVVDALAIALDGQYDVRGTLGARG